MDGEIDTKATWKEYAKAKNKTFLAREIDSAKVELHPDIAIGV